MTELWPIQKFQQDAFSGMALYDPQSGRVCIEVNAGKPNHHAVLFDPEKVEVAKGAFLNTVVIYPRETPQDNNLVVLWGLDDKQAKAIVQAAKDLAPKRQDHLLLEENIAKIRASMNPMRLRVVDSPKP